MFKNKKPVIAKDAHIAENASLIGNIKIDSLSSVWYGAVLRADLSSITIGKGSNVQDNATIHVDVNNPCVIGDNVTIGHNAVIHGATIENNCLIGMGAIILNGAKILEGSIVAAGAVVPENMIVGPRKLAVGTPAKIVTDIDDIHLNKSISNAKTYIDLAKKHFSYTNNNSICDGCNKCMPCAADIDIPTVITFKDKLNQIDKSNKKALDNLINDEKISRAMINAAYCKRCNKCVRCCPKNIDIPLEITLNLSEYKKLRL